MGTSVNQARRLRRPAHSQLLSVQGRRLWHHCCIGHVGDTGAAHTGAARTSAASSRRRLLPAPALVSPPLREAPLASAVPLLPLPKLAPCAAFNSQHLMHRPLDVSSLRPNICLQQPVHDYWCHTRSWCLDEQPRCHILCDSSWIGSFCWGSPGCVACAHQHPRRRRQWADPRAAAAAAARPVAAPHPPRPRWGPTGAAPCATS